jgi:hypothetical protein
MCRCGDRRHAGRKCSKQIRRHVDCCVSDKIWTVSAGVPRCSTGGRRRHGGRGHHGFSHRTRVTQWLGKGHWVHGRELWRRLGTNVGQFRRWNVARSYRKRELRRCLERAATIISHYRRAGPSSNRDGALLAFPVTGQAQRWHGTHAFRQCNDCGEFDRAFAWVHRPAFLSANTVRR